MDPLCGSARCSARAASVDGVDRRKRRREAEPQVAAMDVIYANDIDEGRRHRPIGRIRAVAGWRGGLSPATEADRLAAVKALIREAEGCDADAVVEVRFEVDSVKNPDIVAATLTRVAATGVAVRYAEAA